MFPRACRQKQPERRLFLLSASPHPPITKTGESRFFYCRQSRFVRRLAACPQRTGLRLGHLNSPRSPALSLLIKMFPRACRQKQPERRLFLLSASPHPPITKTGESRFFLLSSEPFRPSPCGLSSTDGITAWASKFAAVACAFLAH